MEKIHKDLQAVLDFWFEELQPKDWYMGGERVDKMIAERFTDTHKKVAAGEYWQERTSPQAYLAEIIVLDQFSRNLFRGSGESFAYDGQALTLSQIAIKAGHDKNLEQNEKQFVYMPFMHSESRAVHEDAVRLFESLGSAESLKYEHIHKDIIDRFGRYPHRNELLGRESTPEEKDYLANNQESFF